MSGKVTTSQPRASHRDNGMPQLDPSGEIVAGSKRGQYIVDKFPAGEQRVFRRKTAAQSVGGGRRKIHRERGEESRLAPTPDRRADVITFQNGDVKTAPNSSQRGSQSYRPRSDYD